MPELETVPAEGDSTAARQKIPSPTPGPPAVGIDLLRQPSGKSLSKVASADMSAASEGLVDRLDSASSAIKAVSSQPAGGQAPYNLTASAAQRPLPRHTHAAAQGQAQNVEQILVAPSPARQQSSRSSPLKPSRQGSSSGGISLDGAAARTGAKAASSSSPPKKANRFPTRDLDRMHVEQQAPARFICPISGRVMRDPVILVTGTTCDRASMEGWLAKGHKSCPVTRQLLKKPIHLVPNLELRNHITTWAVMHAPWMVDREKQLRSNAPDRLEAQGWDPQYVMPLKDDSEAPGAAGASVGGRSDSRSLGRAGRQWEYTADGKLVSKDADGRSKVIDVKANGGAEERATPWRTSRGLRSQPRDSADSRSGRSKRSKRVRDWYSTGFLGLVTIVYVALFIASLGKGRWKPAPMSVNPWFGADAEALAGVGAAVLPLMEGPGKQWWRLVTAPFLPAGLVHLAISAAGLWGYGRYAQMALPLPQVSVAGVYLLPALVASLASANLNTAFLACGATAGTCALLGAIAADQALHFQKKKLFNLKEWWLVALILLLNAAAFIALSLMPMTDPWFPAVGLVAGFLMSTILLTLRRVGKGRPGNRRWAATQIVCALILVGATTACIVGCAMPSKVGQKVPVLKSAACVDLGGKWWDCLPYGSLRSGCALTMAAGGNATLTCPATGAQVAVPGAGPAQMANTTALAGLCTSYCAAAPPPTTVALPIDPLAAGQSAAAPATGASAAVLPPAAVPTTGSPPTDSTATALPTVPITVPTTIQPVVGAPITVTVPSAVASSPLPLLIYVPTLPLGRKLRAGEGSEDVPRQLHSQSMVHSAAGRKLQAGRRRP